jgi:hypothetical protein
MPTYVFVNMKWTGVISDRQSLIQWGPNNGAMFTLGPDDEQNLNGNKLFPAGFCSIVHPYWYNVSFKKILNFVYLCFKVLSFSIG